MSSQPFVHLIWIVPLALLVLYIGSPRFLGTMGTSRVRRVLDSALEKNRYSVLHKLTLPAGGGTVQLDHVVVSRFGIWVIHSIHRSGWISGTEVQDRWTQKVAGRIRRFENPLHQNYLRLQALQSALQLPDSRFHSLVVFSGQRGFKPAAPAKVVTVQQLIRRIRSHPQELLSGDEADEALRCLHQAALPPARFSRVNRWKLLRLFLFFILLAGSYWSFKEPVDSLIRGIQTQANVRMAPEKYTPDGQLKSQQQLYEDSLVCASSVDTGRCACYEPGGGKASLDEDRCRTLAEKDSILKR